MSTNIFLGFPPENIKNWIIAEAERKYQEQLVTPLTFIAEEPNATFSLKSNDGPDVTLETSPTGEEGSWTPYTVGDEITLTNVGDKVMFRNSSDKINTISYDDGECYNYFDINSRKIAAFGNIIFLLDKTGNLRDLCQDEGLSFACLFKNCSKLTKSPILPATILYINSYC